MYPLYHGSHTKIEGYLEPRVSFDHVGYVYATPNVAYALVRAGNINPSTVLIKEDYEGPDKPFRLIEIVPNAFEQAFDTSGYLYLLNSRDFVLLRVGEYACTVKAKIEARFTISNVWDEMQKLSDQYEFIRYEDSEPYWKNVRGGKEGYLQRRAARVEALLKAQQSK